jgi:hypothetical protein
MPQIQVDDDTFAFLEAQAVNEGQTASEYLSYLVEREKLRLKYPPQPIIETKSRRSDIEPPHRKWGM